LATQLLSREPRQIRPWLNGWSQTAAKDQALQQLQG
jgi:hypothetical protein